MKEVKNYSQKPRIDYLDILGCSIKAEFGQYGNVRLTLPIATELLDYQIRIISEAKNEKDMQEIEITLITNEGKIILEACTYYESKEKGFGCELRKKY